MGDADCGLGSGVSCPNTFGVTALGLLASSQVTHDPDHLNAARRAADALVAKHAAAPPCDDNPTTSADRPFTVDVSFLLDAFGKAWDASLDVRAALTVGECAYALDEARQIIVRQPDWDVADPDCPGCDLLAKGLFLAATEDLKQHRDIRAAREQWRGDLLTATSADGSSLSGLGLVLTPSPSQSGAWIYRAAATAPWKMVAGVRPRTR